MVFFIKKGSAVGIRSEDIYQVPKSTYFASNRDSFSTTVILDINTTLSKNSINGYVINDGANNITINLNSQNTASFGNDIILKPKERFSFKALDLNSIKLTPDGTSAYRVFAE